MKYYTIHKRPRESAQSFAQRAERVFASMGVEIKHKHIGGSSATIGFVPKGK